MADQDFVKTGIRGFDELLSGGIPRGNIALVEGAPGTGKTTMGLEFIYRGAVELDEPGLIVLFEVSPEKIIRDTSAFGWNLSELEQSDRVKIIFTTREVFLAKSNRLIVSYWKKRTALEHGEYSSTSSHYLHRSEREWRPRIV